MKILIDIGHPAHVHLFKNFAWIMQNKGNRVLFTTREKEFEIDLLEKCGFQYISFGDKYYSTFGKLFGLLKFDTKMAMVSLKARPDIYLSHGSMYAAQIAWMLGKPHVSFEDTGNQEQVRLYKPFTNVILTSDVFPISYGHKQIRYRGHHELAYLAPNYFRPDDGIFDLLKIGKRDLYAILRFVSWNATHDIGHSGIDIKTKHQIINLLEKKGLKIFISSESKLHDTLQEYQIRIPPEKMHDALYFADIFVGEGATMAMEAGVLGTPSIYVNPLVRSYCQDLEQYDLVYNFVGSDGVLEKISTLIDSRNSREYYRQKREDMLKNKIDVTAFLVWFVEEYPECAIIMKENPGYQNRFK